MQHRSVLAFLFLSMLATSVQADPPWARDGEQRGKDKSHASGQEAGKKQKNRDRFVDQDRATVRDFYSKNPSSLPPGLAKRGGNLPPGLAKRGGTLPPIPSPGEALIPDHLAALLPLPKDLEKLLPPPPHEVIRRIIGRDIVLINEVNHKVLDVLKDALP